MTQPTTIGTGPGATGRPGRRRRAAASVLMVAGLVVAYVVVLPRIGAYGQAWQAIRGLGPAPLALLASTTVASAVLFVWPFRAALPSLSFGRAFVVRQTSFMVSNVVPAGGAVGVGVQQAMLRSYGVSGAMAAAVVGVTALWNLLVTLGLPVLGVAVLLATGRVPQAGEVLAGAAGVLVVAALLGSLVLGFRSDATARWLGDVAERWLTRLLSAVGRRRELHVTEAVLRFRTDTVEVVRRRWRRITAANVASQLGQFAILAVAVAALDDRAAVTTAESFTAFALARLGTFVPVTPGGLGTVDAAMAAALSGFGAASSAAVAAVLVWRAVGLVPQALVGVLTLGVWRRHEGRTASRVPASVEAT